VSFVEMNADTPKHNKNNATHRRRTNKDAQDKRTGGPLLRTIGLVSLPFCL